MDRPTTSSHADRLSRCSSRVKPGDIIDALRHEPAGPRTVNHSRQSMADFERVLVPGP